MIGVLVCAFAFSSSAAALTDASAVELQNGTLNTAKLTLGKDKASTTHYRTGFIEVSAGDTVTFGPTDASDTTSYIFVYTEADAKATASTKITDASITKVMVNESNANNTLAFCTYTVPEGVNFVRITGNKNNIISIDEADDAVYEMYNKYTVAVNNVFTLNEFNAYWDTIYCTHVAARTHVEADPHTCTKDGNFEYWICSQCGEYMDADIGGNIITDRDSVIDRATHHLEDTFNEPVAHTATTDGNIKYRDCTVCYKHFDENDVEITDISDPHNFGRLGRKVDADCENDGAEAHFQCSVCDRYFDYNKNATTWDALTISSEGHAYGSEISVAPSCETSGMEAHYHCQACDKYFDASRNETTKDALEIEAIGHHEYGELKQSPATACGTAGMEPHYQCSVCSKYFDENQTETTREALIITVPHTLAWVPTVEPTCTENGTHAHYHCSACGKNFDSNKDEVSSAVLVYEACGHAYKDEDYVYNNDATYDTDGTKTAICYRCSLLSSKHTIPDVGTAIGFAVKFVDEVKALEELTGTEELYVAIVNALKTYSTLSDEQKQEVVFEHDRLDLTIAIYNAKVKAANAELEKATTVSFSTIIGHFTFLAALWFVLKKKFSI